MGGLDAQNPRLNGLVGRLVGVLLLVALQCCRSKKSIWDGDRELLMLSVSLLGLKT